MNQSHLLCFFPLLVGFKGKQGKHRKTNKKHRLSLSFSFFWGGPQENTHTHTDPYGCYPSLRARCYRMESQKPRDRRRVFSVYAQAIRVAPNTLARCKGETLLFGNGIRKKAKPPCIKRSVYSCGLGCVQGDPNKTYTCPHCSNRAQLAFFDWLGPNQDPFSSPCNF